MIKTGAGNRRLTDLEKCLIIILRSKNHIPSHEILKLAKKIKMCASCSDRSEVFAIGERLIKKKLVKRTFSSNQYVWELTKLGEFFSKEI